jgi:ATP synthase F1 gamma subunit
MATLKIIALRLKSVKNIQKITQSMKMVSAAKYTRAERELRNARPYGSGAQSFFQVTFTNTRINCIYEDHVVEFKIIVKHQNCT